MTRAWTVGLVSLLLVGAVVAAPAVAGGSTAGVGGSAAAVGGSSEAAGGSSEAVGGSAVGVGDSAAAIDGWTAAPDAVTTCFAGSGHPLSIGDGAAGIEVRLHLSLLTSPDAPGEFGAEYVGTLGDERIVTLATGVRLQRPDLVGVVPNPLSAFSLLYTYEFRLPMFDDVIGESRYTETEAPVDSAAGEVAC